MSTRSRSRRRCKHGRLLCGVARQVRRRRLGDSGEVQRRACVGTDSATTPVAGGRATRASCSRSRHPLPNPPPQAGRSHRPRGSTPPKANATDDPRIADTRRHQPAHRADAVLGRVVASAAAHPAVRGRSCSSPNVIARYVVQSPAGLGRRARLDAVRLALRARRRARDAPQRAHAADGIHRPHAAGRAQKVCDVAMLTWSSSAFLVLIIYPAIEYADRRRRSCARRRWRSATPGAPRRLRSARSCSRCRPRCASPLPAPSVASGRGRGAAVVVCGALWSRPADVHGVRQLEPR